MHILTNKLVMAVVAGVVSLGVVGGGVMALSQSDGSIGVVQMQPASSPKRGEEGKPGLKHDVRVGVEEILAAAGLTKQQVMQGLKDGKSLNQIIEDNGGDPAAVQKNAINVATTKINDAVKAGKLTQEQATKLLARLTAELPKLMDQTHTPGQHGTRQDKPTRPGQTERPAQPGKPGDHRPGIVPRGMGEVDAAATAIGITPVQLAQELRGGKSIADVATAHGIAVDKVIDAMTAAANKRIDDAVSSGRIDATKAAEMKTHIKDMVTKLVNAKRK